MTQTTLAELTKASTAQEVASAVELESEIRRALKRLERLTLSSLVFPTTSDPLAAYNEHLMFAVSCYTLRFTELLAQVSDALRQRRYLMVAMCCRAIVENCVTIWDFVHAPEIVDLSKSALANSLTSAGLQKGHERLDRFSRGNKFTWDKLLSGQLDGLAGEPMADTTTQRRVGKLVLALSKSESAPALDHLYAALCDMVHPNFGSNLLVLCEHDEQRIVPAFICRSVAGTVALFSGIGLPALRKVNDLIVRNPAFYGKSAPSLDPLRRILSGVPKPELEDLREIARSPLRINRRLRACLVHVCKWELKRRKNLPALLKMPQDFMQEKDLDACLRDLSALRTDLRDKDYTCELLGAIGDELDRMRNGDQP